MLSLWKDLTKMAVCSPWGFMGHRILFPKEVTWWEELGWRPLWVDTGRRRDPPWSTLPHLSVPGVHRWGVGQALGP